MASLERSSATGRISRPGASVGSAPRQPLRKAFSCASTYHGARPAIFGARIAHEDEQLKLGPGYDHHYVLNKKGSAFSLAARISEPKSGRVMDVRTTEPGIQLYTGNWLGDEAGKGGRKYPRRSGFCLETQHYPDSPNRPEFPSIPRFGESPSGDSPSGDSPLAVSVTPMTGA